MTKTPLRFVWKRESRKHFRIVRRCAWKTRKIRRRTCPVPKYAHQSNTCNTNLRTRFRVKLLFSPGSAAARHVLRGDVTFWGKCDSRKIQASCKHVQELRAGAFPTRKILRQNCAAADSKREEVAGEARVSWVGWVWSAISNNTFRNYYASVPCCRQFVDCVVKCFGQSLIYGSEHIHHSLSRMLSLWLRFLNPRDIKPISWLRMLLQLKYSDWRRALTEWRRPGIWRKGKDWRYLLAKSTQPI